MHYVYSAVTGCALALSLQGRYSNKTSQSRSWKTVQDCHKHSAFGPRLSSTSQVFEMSIGVRLGVYETLNMHCLLTVPLNM